MKRIFLLIAFMAGGLYAQNQRTVDASITGVTVYVDRAAITRSAEIFLNPGDYDLLLKDLPSSLQDQSLRVGGSGSASAKITDIKIEMDYIDTLPKNRLKELQDQLVILQADERVFSDRLALLSKEKELLNEIKNSVVSQSNNKDVPKPSMDDWTKLFVFYDGNIEKINDEIRTLEKKKGDVTSKKNVIQQQINQLSGYSKLTRKKVWVSVSVAKAGNLNLDVSYVLTGAKWYPVYDVRVSPDDKTVDMVYYAMVAQNTGEDWKGVKLSISTARPNISATMPQLSSWYLNVYDYYLGADDKSFAPMSGAGAGARTFSKKSEKQKDVNVDEEEKAGEVNDLISESAVVETRSTSVVFNVVKPSTIPSDNFDHKVMITTEKLKSDFEYSSVPKLSQLAYLKGKIENTTDVPFLAGSANVFFGNSFVGTSYLNTVIPTETFNVFLGVDDAIKIKREQVRDYKAETGIFSKSTKKTFEYKITIESFKKTEDTITVQDQFPISQDERIKVEAVIPQFEKDKAIAAHPNGVIERKGNGVIEWRLRIKPKEKIELRIKYVVEYPKEIQVDGL
ncbi:mucoidy inhibitor MuiA family protein [bacterium]|nr:mucoidy inhibitor MuiA family protein [bacterium]